MMAAEREIVDEAYAGDIIGVFDPGIFSIGDTITVPGKKFMFSGIPTFEPEHFMHEGDPAELVPSGAKTRIRNLQVHGKDVETAYAGQRVAVNLAGLKKTDVQRGDAVARPGSVRISRMLDVRLQNLRDSQRVILNDSQVHLYHGAAVLLAKIVLLDRDSLNPGESCYAQLRLTEPIASKNGDRFVIRFLSPMETIGGGMILDDAPPRHRRNVPAVMEALKIRESGSSGERIIQVTAEFGTALPDGGKLSDKLGMEAPELELQLRELVAVGRLVEPLPNRFAAAEVMDGVRDACQALLEDYHRKNPLHAGMKAAELRQKLFKSMDGAIISGNCVSACDKNTTYHHQNNPVVADLFAQHGKTLNYVCNIITNENVYLADKQRSSDWASKLAGMLDLDGVIISEEGFGNPDTDLIMMEMVLDVDDIVNEMTTIREQYCKY